MLKQKLKNVRKKSVIQAQAKSKAIDLVLEEHFKFEDGPQDKEVN